MARLVEDMEYPAAMTAPKLRSITPHRPADPVVAGAFRQGPRYATWRPAGSGDWLLLHTTHGGGLITAAGRRHRLAAGAVALFAPDAAQDYATHPDDGTWQLQWAHFQPKPEWRAWLRGPAWAPGVYHHTLRSVEVQAKVTSALRRVVAHRRQAWLGAVDLAMNALEETLLWIETDQSDDPHWRLDARVRRAMDDLAAHPERRFDLAALATHCGLSVSRLGHLFKAATGLSPQRYAEELKLREARALLRHTSLSVGEVATATGFADPFYFSKRFRRFAGAAPSQSRAFPPFSSTSSARESRKTGSAP